MPDCVSVRIIPEMSHNNVKYLSVGNMSEPCQKYIRQRNLPEIDQKTHAILILVYFFRSQNLGPWKGFSKGIQWKDSLFGSLFKGPYVGDLNRKTQFPCISLSLSLKQGLEKMIEIPWNSLFKGPYFGDLDKKAHFPFASLSFPSTKRPF